MREGLFVGYLTSRETAAALGQRSNGAMRASGWNRIPLIRMTNVSLEPGEWTLADLIADTDDGIYMETNRSWSIDDKRLNFQFGTEIGREIKNGKLGDLVKNPTYTGITPRFWGSCDAVANRDEWVVWGTPNCGKGQPEQVAHTGHGAAAARFRGVRSWRNEVKGRALSRRETSGATRWRVAAFRSPRGGRGRFGPPRPNGCRRARA